MVTSLCAKFEVESNLTRSTPGSKVSKGKLEDEGFLWYLGGGNSNILTNANMESEKITPCNKEHFIFQVLHLGGGNSNIIEIFNPKIGGNDPNWLVRAYFSNGLKPPTRYDKCY